MSRQKSGAGLKGVSFITDEAGRKKAVVVDLSLHKKALEEFLEDLYGHQKIQERKREPCLTKEEFLKGLENDRL